MKHRSQLVDWAARLVLLCPFMFVAHASAGEWQWACEGKLGNEQIAFNRNKLVIISNGNFIDKLDDLIHSEDFKTKAKQGTDGQAVTASYMADDSNSGLDKTMSFTRESADDYKLVLTELSSKTIGHKERLIASCRDETIDRFRKDYRVERGKEPPQTVTLTCIEYTLSTRGGRTCK